MLTVHVKRFGFPKLGISLVQVSLCPLPIALWELWLTRVVQNYDALAPVIVVNNNLFIVSDSRISCLQPGAIKLWQSNVLVVGRLKSQVPYSSWQSLQKDALENNLLGSPYLQQIFMRESNNVTLPSWQWLLEAGVDLRPWTTICKQLRTGRDYDMD